MIKIAQIKFTPWSKTYDFNARDINLKVNDQVVVKTEIGTEVGRVVNINEVAEESVKLDELKDILRRASTSDLAKVAQDQKNKEQTLEYCRKQVIKHNLPMKLVDAHFSFDGGRITFAFIADGRVDFRDLVKDLTRHFQKSIRLHQLGIRDEAKISGDIGPCGQRLCCANFLKELGNVTSELVENQQVAHRGSERLSGVCGRLMCCLAFEKEQYEELRKKMPALNSEINTPQGKGKVVALHILKQTVNAKLADGRVVEVDLAEK